MQWIGWPIAQIWPINTFQDGHWQPSWIWSPFDLQTPRTLPKNQISDNLCGDIEIWNFPNERSVVLGCTDTQLQRTGHKTTADRTYSMSVAVELINFLLESSHLLHCEIALKVSLTHCHLHVVSCLHTHTHTHTYSQSINQSPTNCLQ